MRIRISFRAEYSVSLLGAPTEFTVGDAVVAVYDISYPAIFVHDSIDFIIQSINIHSSWGMAFVATRVKHLSITDYHVAPHDERWLSANSDCMHFISTTEYISLPIAHARCKVIMD
jgi:hypothetical protein